MTADTPDPTAQDIAGRLSPAQKKALLWLPADGSEIAEVAHPASIRGVSLWALKEKRLAPCIFARLAEYRHDNIWDHSPVWRATSLGQRVRAILAAEPAPATVAPKRQP